MKPKYKSPEYKSIGKNFHPKHILKKIKGDAKFCADIKFKNSIALKALRSSKHHAVIENIDISKAMKIPGVIKIFRAKDIPGKNLIGILNKDQPLLIDDKVRSKADPIALIAAKTDNIALKALKKIHVTYKELKPIFSIKDALLKDAYPIHKTGNNLFTSKVKKGDIKKGFKNCFSIIKNQYKTHAVEHNYIEPDAGAGYVDKDGTLVIYASTQNPHYDHQELASLLNLEHEKIRIIQAVTGGGFGSKLDLNVQGFIGLGLYYLKKPVHYIYTQEEAYLATGKRHPFIINIKTGTNKNGKLLAIKIRAYCNTGAYGSYGIAVANRAAVHGTGPYEIDNVDIKCSCVYTNQTFCGAMRGFGVPQIAFAHESQIDIHAQNLGINPIEIRIINGLRKGSINGTSQRLDKSIGFQKCLKKIKPYYKEALKDFLTKKTLPFVKKGIGIGSMFYGIGNTGVKNPSSAKIEINQKGLITLFTGCADLGQGSTAILTQIAAEILGISPKSIHVVTGDTKLTTSAGATSASRQTYISGNAVKNAAEKLVKIFFKKAVEKFKVSKNILKLQNNNIYISGNIKKSVDFAWLGKRLYKKGKCFSCQGYFNPKIIPLDPETGKGTPYGTYAFACHLAMVEVDILTGQVNVKKIIAAHDLGRVINPKNVLGQIYGGVAMGLGFALMEEFEFGKTKSMKDYYIPTFQDMPEIVPILIESLEPTGPFGAKGVGEPALIPTAPAIINAITNALGKRIYSLPGNLEKVLNASIKSGHFNKFSGCNKNSNL